MEVPRAQIRFFVTCARSDDQYHIKSFELITAPYKHFNKHSALAAERSI